MTTYDWPGQGDPNRKDRAKARTEFNLSWLEHLPAQLERTISEARAGLLALLHDDDNLWLPIGPSTVIRGQAQGAPRVSGRIRDLAVSSDAQRVYAASAGGGVWYSGDAGTTWTPVGGWADTPTTANTARPTNALSCGTLLVDFGAAADGSGDTVLVGTGELRPERQATPGGQLGGVGILRLREPLPTVLANPLGNPWELEPAPHPTNPSQHLLDGAGIYRLVSDPALATRVVAATSIGLFARDGAPGTNWERVSVDPFAFDANDGKWCTDVLWTPAVGGEPARLWVTLLSGSAAELYYSEAGLSGPFQRLALAGAVPAGRLGLAFSAADPSIVYVLGASDYEGSDKGPRLWRIEGVTVHRVRRTPERLFGQTKDKDQSHYDLSIAVHPDNPSRIVMGGSGIRMGSWEASIFAGEVTGSAAAGFDFAFAVANQATPHADPTFVGSGVHADIHALRYVSLATRVELWVGCDGGVFRSRSDGARDTFIARNTGLATLEPGYVACHPLHDGVVLAGTQDNGVLQRIGDTIWLHVQAGDGGGVAFHPTHPAFYVSQYIRGSWNSNGPWVPPVHRDGDSQDSITKEEKDTSFYSGVSVMPIDANQARVAVGTKRVWISENWDPTSAAVPPVHWVTLPTAVDPRNGDLEDWATDIGDGGAIITVRWASADRLLVLSQRAVHCFERTGGRWERHIISHRNRSSENYENGTIAPTGPMDHLPPLGRWSDLALHDASRGTHGSFYVSTTGHARLDDDTLVESDRMDTLWWYDGTSNWHRTGLRSAAAGHTKAPVFAAIVDPDDASVVYVGTTIGVWRGTLSFAGTTPSWVWEPLLNGLPEAAVQDLSFFRRDTTRLLRAGLQARGVWELDLSASPLPAGRTYLRSHAVDTSRALTRGTTTDPIATTFMSLEWMESPDLRIRPAPRAPVNVLDPSDHPPTRHGGEFSPHNLWVFQTTLHDHDPLVRPDGRFSDNFRRRLTAFRTAQALPDPAVARIDDAAWNRVMTVGRPFATPWDGQEPSEADLHELVVHETRSVLLDARLTPCVVVRNRPHLVDVLVHHRHIRPLPPADVSVLLVRRRIPTTEHPDDLHVSAAWKAAVVSRLQGGTPALDDGWQVVDPASPVRHPTAPLDARTPRPVTFQMSPPSPLDSIWLMLAIVSSTRDPISVANLAESNVSRLAKTCHHLAAALFTVRVA